MDELNAPTPEPSLDDIAGALSRLEPTVAPAELDAHAAAIHKLTEVNEELRLRVKKAERAVNKLQEAIRHLNRAFGGERLHPDQRARFQTKAREIAADPYKEN
jgi:chromosome segregation ATPase